MADVGVVVDMLSIGTVIVCLVSVSVKITRERTQQMRIRRKLVENVSKLITLRLRMHNAIEQAAWNEVVKVCAVNKRNLGFFLNSELNQY